MAKKYENLLRKSKLPQTAQDRRLAAAARIAQALDAAARKPDAKGAKDVCVRPVRREASGKSVATGEVEGLRIGDDPTRHAYAAAFKALENEGIAKLKWNLKDKNKMPTSCKVKKSNFERLMRFCDCESGDFSGAQAPKEEPSQPSASWDQEGNAKKATILRRQGAAARISNAAQRAVGQAGDKELVTVGVWLGKASRVEGARECDVLFRTNAESAPARSVLGELARCSIATVKLGPSTEAGQRADVFFSRAGAEMLGRAVEVSHAAPRPSNAPKAASNAASAAPKPKAAASRNNLAAAQAKLEEFCRTCPNLDLQEVMRHAAAACAKGRTDPWLASALDTGQLDRLLRFFKVLPFPASPPIEVRSASILAFGSSKAMGSSLQRQVATVAALAGGEGVSSPGADDMSAWGLVHCGCHVLVGGDFSLKIGGRVLDLGAAGTLAALDVLAADEVSGCDSRGVRAVVIVENQAAWAQAVRDLGELACFAYCKGTWNEATLAFVDALRRALGGGRAHAPLLLWFDIDAGGFERAGKLMERYPDARPVLMSEQDLAEFAKKATLPIVGGRRKALDGWILQNDGSPFLRCALACKKAGFGIEQEAMLDGYAQRRLKAALLALPTRPGGVQAQSGAEPCRITVDKPRRGARVKRETVGRLACAAAAGSASGLVAALAVGAVMARRQR